MDNPAKNVALEHRVADFPTPYWAKSIAVLFTEYKSQSSGLSTAEATGRLQIYGSNTLRVGGRANVLRLLLKQFLSPLVLILIFAAIVAAGVGEIHDAVIIGCIVGASCLLGFSQEFSASRAIESLRRGISLTAAVIRDGKEQTIPADRIVPGDIIKLSAGSLVPADAVLLSTQDLNVTEAALTGETFPVAKAPGISKPDTPIDGRLNCVFTGTSVRSGIATALAVKTGNNTEFAAIAGAITREIPETDFARGIRRFGYLMTRIMLVIVFVVFIANLLLHRPLIDSLLFSLALAVGLTPELLPAIISVTLARGARVMARQGVIIRRLEAMENLGSMDMLCTDKTGTLTEGTIRLDKCVDVQGQPSDQVRLLAILNAGLQAGLKNPLDDAILAEKKETVLSAYRKLGEIPYDFARKRLSVVVAQQDGAQLICKGAVTTLLDICTTAKAGSVAKPIDAQLRAEIDGRYQRWSEDGIRVIAVATGSFDQQKTPLDKSDETALCLEGFLLFLDPPKAGVKEVLGGLRKRGIGIKIISGDNRYVVAHLAKLVGLKDARVLSGRDIASMSNDALFAKATKTDLFAEIDPNQKERIIKALRRANHVVGYMGDGINDAPALHEADVGISVDSAVDVAREAADVILLRRDLDVLMRGVDDGRRTFANTLKYISIATSANFGNMISMAIASLLLPFLPLLAKQILLNNLLADIPSMTIATDRVDPAEVQRPKRWNIAGIQRFMLCFGPISSLFDFVTFGFLLFAGVGVDAFRTGWFVESLTSQIATMLIVRTVFSSWKSRPSGLLVATTAPIGLVGISLPYLPFAETFGFVPLPFSVLGALLSITVAFAVALEMAKSWFFRHERKHSSFHRKKLR
ncbi:magnesium-translocating P-type ATPase [Rhizobium jaguaris]|uniref:Magnesium-transporting ATPase, P-type 1 n=1 Tax=Rhizobium jaguaris TaxID=1312183 RepID=A0A387FZA3_9HYPH|nr:magnesium-translocating P-type ATPase [Rhizobium jaguaris]AYG62555.1 magnesium-translocating P-type ATPase [Rhizobium jaguaris]